MTVEQSTVMNKSRRIPAVHALALIGAAILIPLDRWLPAHLGWALASIFTVTAISLIPRRPAVRAVVAVIGLLGIIWLSWLVGQYPALDGLIGRRVVVKDISGNPLAGVDVQAISPSMNGPILKTDRNGEARVSLGMGGQKAQWISAAKAGFEPVQLPVPGQTPIQIVLRASTTQPGR